jgi:hypothetical protein
MEYMLRTGDNIRLQRGHGAMRLPRLRAMLNAIWGKVPGKPDRLDTATRMARDADFTDAPEPEARKIDPIEELRRAVNRRSGSHLVRRRTAPEATPRSQ